MRILYILKSLALWGGGERILTEKMNYLCSEFGYSIYVITINQGQHPITYPLNKNIQHTDLNIDTQKPYRYKYPIRIFEKIKINKKIRQCLLKKIEQVKPQIINCIVDDYVDIISSITTQKKIPLIVESHNLRSFTRTPGAKKITWIQSVLRECYFKKIRKASSLVCITQGDAKDWKDIKKATIIPNCIHFNTESLSTCEEKKVILVGRLAYQKGIDLAIKAWKTVTDKHPDWELHIYGNGELENDVRLWIQQAELEKTVILHHPTENIFSAYRNSSISLCTSRYEAFGLVIAEAMSCGIPCVAFKCPYGPENIIDHGTNGFLIPPRKTGDMAAAICTLIESPALRKNMGREAHEKAKIFLPQNIMPMWKQLFTDIISQ